MTARERWFALALRTYPRTYRAERGDEMMATLIESSETAGWASIAADGLDLVTHGLRQRAGLGSERFAGRMLLLAALPALMVAAAFSTVMLVFGELRPLGGPPFLPFVTAHFGPFHTVAALAYLAWIIGALCALARPRWQRRAAGACLVVTAVAIPLGNAFFAPRPTRGIFVLLLMLGIPAVLAPSPERRHLTNTWVAVIVGVVVLAVLWYASWSWDGPTLSNTLFAASIFRYRFWFPDGVLFGMGLGAGLVVAGRGTLAGAGAIVVAPWLVFAGHNLGAPSLSFSGFDVVLFAIIAAWILASWSWDLRTHRHQLPGPPVSG